MKNFKKPKKNPFFQKRKTEKKASENQYLIGKFDATSLMKGFSFAFVICENVEVKIFSENTLNAYHNDKVEIKIVKKINNSSIGIVSKIIERGNKNFIGTLIKEKKKFFLTSIVGKIHTDIEAINATDTQINYKVVVNIENWGNEDRSILPQGKICEILGKSGEIETEITAILKHHELPLSFPDNVLKELDYIDNNTENLENNRIDYRNILTFTIDPITAKDYDDAISLEKTKNGYKLYVHIADVSNYLSPKSAIFNEAMQRGNSYYFPKKVLPMLPEKLCNNVCSLRPYEDKFTLSIITEFDEDINIINQKVEKSIICSDMRLTYEDVDKLFSQNTNKNIPDNIAQNLFLMKKLSLKLSERLIKKGYISFELPEIVYHFNDEGAIESFSLSENTESHKLVENFMLIANEYAAKFLAKSTNTIYRIHEKPEITKIKDMYEILSNYEIKVPYQKNHNFLIQKLLESMPNEKYHLVFDKVILKSLKRAKYHTENYGHFGLGLKYYTHFTSPIRRISDLIIHMQIKNILDGKKQTFNFQKLKEIALHASETERVADEAENEVNKFYILNYMKNKIGDIFSGIIINVSHSYIKLQIKEIPIYGVIKVASLKDYFKYDDKKKILFSNKKSYKLADTLKVKVEEISDEVYLSEVQNENINKKPFNDSHHGRKKNKNSKRPFNRRKQ